MIAATPRIVASSWPCVVKKFLTSVSSGRVAGAKAEHDEKPVSDADLMLVHVVNHSTYHRGQVVTMLRQLGKSARPTDYLVFLDEG